MFLHVATRVAPHGPLSIVASKAPRSCKPLAMRRSDPVIVFRESALVTPLPQSWQAALATRHTNHHQGFLCSRAALLEALGSSGGAACLDEVVDRGAFCNAHPSTSMSLTHDSDNYGLTVAAAVVGCGSVVAVDTVLERRVALLTVRRPQWRARWLGAPRTSGTSRWSELWRSSGTMSSDNVFVDAVGWAVREAAVKILAEPSPTAFMMADIASLSVDAGTSVVTAHLQGEGERRFTRKGLFPRIHFNVFRLEWEAPTKAVVVCAWAHLCDEESLCRDNL